MSKFFEVWIYNHMKAIEKKLDHIESLSETQTRKVSKMSAQLDALVAQVAATDGVIDSAVVLINGLGTRLDAVIAELQAAQVDTTKLEELSADLKTGTDELAAAVAAAPAP